jgi:probable phosphoglycerate mutase
VENGISRIVLIRHGESHSNANGWISGQDSCKGLTEVGQVQAEALRDRLIDHDDLRPDRIIVSTMLRAVQTAEIIGQAVGIEPSNIEQRPELIERTSGECEGMNVGEYEEKYGRPPWTDWMNPLSPGGESGEEFFGRVSAATDRVVSEARGKTYWVVCHGGVIMSTAVGRWPGNTDAIQPGALPIQTAVNTSMSEWFVGGDPAVWSMRRYNDHAHLDHL